MRIPDSPKEGSQRQDEIGIADHPTIADTAISSISTPQHNLYKDQIQREVDEKELKIKMRIERRKERRRERMKNMTEAEKNRIRKRKRIAQRKYSEKIKKKTGYGSLLSARIGKAREASKVGKLTREQHELLTKEYKRQHEWKEKRKEIREAQSQDNKNNKKS